jgi:monoamine oxidase
MNYLSHLTLEPTIHKKNQDTIIIGAGISGIYAASLLAEMGESFIVLEARDRVGGRILSPDYKGYFTDLGPSWYWPEINPRIKGLIQELGLTGYPQYNTGYGRFQAVDGSVRTVSGYPEEPESWRVSGGMISLVDGLCKKIPKEAIMLNHPVCEIERKEDHSLVSVGILGQKPRRRFRSSRILLALPPRLAAAAILFTPDLSHELTQAMLKTSTWMAGQAKFYAIYDRAGWRHAGFSGQAFSEYGPLVEIHDGSNRMDNPFGLTGFVGIPAAQRRNKQMVIQAILRQLQLLYGEDAGRPATVFYKDWAMEEFTATEYDQRTVHDHPLYQPPLGKTDIWDGLVFFMGTETSDQLGGYIEGALASAERAIYAAPHVTPPI